MECCVRKSEGGRKRRDGPLEGSDVASVQSWKVNVVLSRAHSDAAAFLTSHFYYFYFIYLFLCLFLSSLLTCFAPFPLFCYSFCFSFYFCTLYLRYLYVMILSVLH
jgi:hypothetical protein